MYIKADKYFNDEIKNYDMLVLPGGRPGGQNLLENQDVISLVQYFNEHHQYISDDVFRNSCLRKSQCH